MTITMKKKVNEAEADEEYDDTDGNRRLMRDDVRWMTISLLIMVMLNDNDDADTDDGGGC